MKKWNRREKNQREIIVKNAVNITQLKGLAVEWGTWRLPRKPGAGGGHSVLAAGVWRV